VEPPSASAGLAALAWEPKLVAVAAEPGPSDPGAEDAPTATAPEDAPAKGFKRATKSVRSTGPWGILPYWMQ